MIRTYDDLEEIRCPACDKKLTSQKAIPKHCGGCPKWGEKIGIPSSDFDFHKHFQVEMHSPGLVEGRDYVECKVCLEGGEIFRRRRIVSHIKKKHGLSKSDYLETYPGTFTSCSETNAIRKATVRDRYGVDNVFQSDEIKDKFEVLETAWSPEARASREATNLKRYGHENPFGGRQGAKRAREGMRAKYGHSNPQQVPEIRDRTLKTNKNRYGKKHYFETEEFKEKYKEVSLEKWGAEHPMKTEEGKALVRQTMLAKYGAEHPMAVEEFYQKRLETCRESTGYDWPLESPEVHQKSKKTWLRTRGVDNPSRDPEVLEKIKNTWIENYGVPFPPQSMQQTFDSPNLFEQRVAALSSKLYFTGAGKVWVKLHTLDKNKNPDFIVIPPGIDPGDLDLSDYKPKKVVEAFGWYWHGPDITGVSREEHEQELIAAYAAEGIECFVIWEGEENLGVGRIKEFLMGGHPPV